MSLSSPLLKIPEGCQGPQRAHTPGTCELDQSGLGTVIHADDPGRVRMFSQAALGREGCMEVSEEPEGAMWGPRGRLSGCFALLLRVETTANFWHWRR